MFDKTTLKMRIKKAIQNSYPDNAEDKNGFAENLSSDLAEAIDEYVRKVQVQPGQAVAGSLGAGTTTSPGILM